MDAATLVAARAEAGEAAGEAIDRTSPDAASPGRERGEKARADLLKVTAPMRRRFLGSLRDMIKGSVLADPDMWPSIRSGASTALDRMLLDIEHEIERNLHFSLLQQQADADALGPTGGMLTGIWWRFRAFVLHHYLPHNRYIFGKLKDPVYLLLYMLTMVPVHGVRVAVFSVILLMIAFPGPPDEYQLINYVLLFKGMQFLTSGLIAMAMGAMKYFVCFSWHKDALLACVDAGGPGANDSVGQLIDYLGSITLVWIAFSLLHRSKRYAPEAPITSGKVTASDKEGAGGRLRHLLCYDVKCFVLSLMLLLLLTVATCFDRFQSGSLGSLFTDPQFCANVFWCCNLYSILSLPFASFSIPGWQAVLTHSDPTGFNKHGACVPFGLSSVESKDEAEQDEDGFTRVASIATSVLSVMEKGREARGSQTQGDYQFGDLGRGLWHSFWGAPQSQGAEAAAEEGQEEEYGVGASLSGLVQSISDTGRKARVEAEGEPQSDWGITDFGRGLWWTLRSSQTGELARSRAASSDNPPAAEWPLAVASVRLPATLVEHWDGVTYFSTEVFAEGSLDADGGSEPWRVLRRYRDFYDLASRLGPRSTRYAEAPFPPKYVAACSDEMLEERRRALEAWLRRVLQDPLSQGPWARALHAFLEADQRLADPKGLGRTASCGSAGAPPEDRRLVPTPTADLLDLVEAEAQQALAEGEVHREHLEGSPVSRSSSGSVSVTQSSCGRSGAMTKDLESGIRNTGDHASCSSSAPKANEEDSVSNAVPEVSLGDVLEGITVVGQKALGSDQPFRKLRTGLWTMLQNTFANDELDARGLEDCEGRAGTLREPLLQATPPDPGAMVPAMAFAEEAPTPPQPEADGGAGSTRQAPPPPPPASPEAEGEVGSTVQARLGRLGRGIWSRIAAVQAFDDLEVLDDHHRSASSTQAVEAPPEAGGGGQLCSREAEDGAQAPGGQSRSPAPGVRGPVEAPPEAGGGGSLPRGEAPEAEGHLVQQARPPAERLGEPEALGRCTRAPAQASG